MLLCRTYYCYMLYIYAILWESGLCCKLLALDLGNFLEAEINVIFSFFALFYSFSINSTLLESRSTRA
jgi:hypothetical protein